MGGDGEGTGRPFFEEYEGLWENGKEGFRRVVRERWEDAGPG